MAGQYKPEVISGTSYVRCNAININNPISGIKSVLFNEEKVAFINDTIINLPLDYSTPRVSALFTIETINEQFPIIDTETNEPTGAVLSFADVYKHLYSLYIYLALKRDAQMEQQP